MQMTTNVKYSFFSSVEICHFRTNRLYRRWHLQLREIEASNLSKNLHATIIKSPT